MLRLSTMMVVPTMTACATEAIQALAHAPPALPDRMRMRICVCVCVPQQSSISIATRLLIATLLLLIATLLLLIATLLLIALLLPIPALLLLLVAHVVALLLVAALADLEERTFNIVLIYADPVAVAERDLVAILQ